MPEKKEELDQLVIQTVDGKKVATFDFNEFNQMKHLVIYKVEKGVTTEVRTIRLTVKKNLVMS